MLLEPQEYNKYAYVQNNPIIWDDSFGLGRQKKATKLERCNDEERRACEEKCCNRGGVKSCNVQLYRRLKGGYDKNGVHLRSYEWVRPEPNCLCNRDDENPPPPPIPVIPFVPGGGGLGGPAFSPATGSGGGSTGGCFTAGTLVHSVNGLVPIENLEIGDKVLAKNEKTGANEFKRVVATVVAIRKDLIKIYPDTNTTKPIICSSNHKFYTKNKGWIAASMLSAKDILADKQSSSIKIRNLEKTLLNDEVRVYNIEVEDLHTYFVGDTGILTHNPFLLKDPGPAWRRRY